MPKMKPQEATRAALLRDGTVKQADSQPTPMFVGGRSSREHSQAVAIAARRAELSSKKIA